MYTLNGMKDLTLDSLFHNFIETLLNDLILALKMVPAKKYLLISFHKYDLILKKYFNVIGNIIWKALNPKIKLIYT